MHGGALGSGAPFGNGNALTHGFFTAEAIDERKFVRTVLTDAETLLRNLDKSGTQRTRPGTNASRRA